MFPGVNKRQAEQMMRQMGIKQVDVDATEVIIKTPTKTIIVHNPSVTKINMMGQDTFQIAGRIEEQTTSTLPDLSDEDVQTVMDTAGVDKITALTAIKNANGDLASAILTLKK